MSLIAAKEAVIDANWTPKTPEDQQNTGVSVGVGLSDLDDITNTGSALEQKYSKVNPFFIPRILTNMAAGQISIKYGFQGPNHSVCTACATGTHAIGDAFRMIKYGDADVMVCGGAEAGVNKLSMAGFSRLRALSVKFNDNPCAASRPFDRDRDGFVIAEGCGIVILEELSHALARKSKIYAEVIGYGMSGDAHHITSPRKDGEGGERAMRKCLQEARLEASDVGYINAHATSTPLGDEIELNAIGRLFSENNVKVSSTKGAVGHLLGAAGAVESVFTILAVHAGFLPPTVNLDNPIDCPKNIDLIANVGEPWVERIKRRIALKNSFGFGGTNASICFASFDE